MAAIDTYYAPEESALTSAASLPASRSSGSLQNLPSADVSTASSQQRPPTTPPRRPLVNRLSNPIISTEDDEHDGADSDTSLDAHLKAGQSSRGASRNASLTDDLMAKAADEAAASVSVASASTAATTAASTIATGAAAIASVSSMNDEPRGTIDYDNMAQRFISDIAMTESLEMPLNQLSPTYTAVSINGSKTSGVDSSTSSTAATANNPKKLSPMSSRISLASEKSSPRYIPPSLSAFTPSMITPNNTTTSITPCSTLTSPPTSATNASTIASRTSNTSIQSNTTADTSKNNSQFDFDATQHNQRKGTGYLASQVSLSTPTDVFASGCTLLQLCAIGNLPSVREYVSKTFSNVNFRDYDRRTALHVASSEGHLDVVKYLVQKGGNVNRSDRWGGSPLDDAHRHRHTHVARYLRSKGSRTGSLNLTANLIAAAAAGNLEEVTMICADVEHSQLVLDLSGSRRGLNNGGGGQGSQTLDGSLGSSRGKVTRGTKLQGKNMDISEPALTPKKDEIDINMGDYDKRTALHLAAGEGHLDLVQFLCKRGANVNAEDRWGGRPLDDALQKGNDRVADQLRKFGATSAGEGEVILNHRPSMINVTGTDNASRRSGILTPGQSLHDQSITGSIEDENLRVEFEELEMIERIGSGAFGEIYKCRWRGILVAAKCIKASKIQKEWILKNRSDMSDGDRRKNRVEAIRQTAITEEEKRLALEDFRRETAIMRRLRHPNIVMMLAYSHSDDIEVMISEICRCSLLDIFKANNISNSQIPKRTQIVYAKQLAQGMNHLHKSRPPIIHRDLKPANLLVDFNGTLKIADFGLAKIRPNSAQNDKEAFLMTGETGSYRFMAPEVFRHEEYTETVDVYSYAMIFYYMLRSTPPWSGLSGLDAVTKAAVDGERPLVPRNVDERLSTLLKRCWDETPHARPSFEEIIMVLNAYSHDVFSTNDKDVTSMMLSSHDKKCGCIVS